MATNFLYDFVKRNGITKPVFIGYFIALTAILYFTFFTIFGQKGLVSYFALKKQIQNKELTKEELSARMETKKNMVEGMNIESLDIDLLDEQARQVLGYAGKNEVVIYPEKNNQNQD